jgi:hypothetical protein
MFGPELNALERDVTGACRGECRDIIREGEEERQRQINAEGIEQPETFPRAKWANERDTQPGVYGGHV